MNVIFDLVGRRPAVQERPKLEKDHPKQFEEFHKLHDLIRSENYFKLLNNQELLEYDEYLEHLLPSIQGTPKEASLHLLRTCVKDALLRRAVVENSFAAQLKNGADKQLAKEVKRATGDLSPKSEAEKAASLAEAIKKNPCKGKKRMLHVCLEYKKVGFTGVNAVATALPISQRKADEENRLDASIVTPFYDIMTSRDIAYKSVEFKGFVKHLYEGKEVVSSVYKVISKDGYANQTPQYLIKPDPQLANLFSIDDNQNVYSSTSKSEEWSRLLYFTSAVSAMAVSYNGYKKDKSFAGVHCHSWTLGMLSWLLRQTNEKRKAAGLPEIQSILHFHSNTFFDFGVINADRYRGIGVDLPKEVKEANTQALSWLAFDGIIHVSKAFAQKAVDEKDEEVAMTDISKEKVADGRLRGVTNGITIKDWSPLNTETYKEFAIKKIADAQGTDTTNYLAAKEKVKQELYKAGIISDPSKPLFVFVGRFAEEKGVKTLPAMIQEIAKQGGQCVVMGTVMGTYSPPSLLIMKEYAQGRYEDCLKVYDDRDFQKQKHKGVDMGLLIRMACDFSLIPSERESCGLVFPEAIAAGCMPITSNVGGLVDFTKPYGKKDGQGKTIGADSFNSFTYDKKKKANAQAAISQAMEFYTTHTPAERNQVVKRLFEESKEYDWSNRVKEIKQFYDSTPAQDASQQKASLEAMKKKYFFPLSGKSIGGSVLSRLKNLVDKVKWAAARAWQHTIEFFVLAGLKLERIVLKAFSNNNKRKKVRFADQLKT